MLASPAPHKTSAPSVTACKACAAPVTADCRIGEARGYALLRCPACATVIVDPWPSVEELIAFYQSYEGTTDYRKKAARKIQRATRRLKKVAARAPGKRLLDVGCNYGFTVKAGLDLGLEVRGIDIDSTAVAASIETFGPHFECIPVQDYAARGESADMIYTSEVVEHVPDPDSFIAAIARILAPRGVLYLTTPDASHFTVPRDFSSWHHVMPPEHITYFTRKGISHLLDRHGLKIEKFFFSLKDGMRLIARKQG